MMGRTHTIQGGVAWLAVTATGLIHQSPAQVITGTVLCAGGALLPDLDMTGRVIAGRGGAVAAATFGRAGLLVAEVVGRLAELVYRATATAHDQTKDTGHRTLTHTWPWQVLAGGLAGLAATTRLGLGILVAVLTAMALRALASSRAPVVYVAAVAMGGVAAVTVGHAAVLTGLAVGVGGLAHMASDSMTVWGVPWAWPLQRHGRRWWCSGLPQALRIHTGAQSTPERVIRWGSVAVGVVLAAQVTGVLPALVS